MIYSLQAMRWIAIFMIFLSHVSFLLDTKYAAIYEKYISGGNFGVSFFFLLSGFLLAYKYYGCITSVDFKYSYNFTVSRIKKFYPLHIITVMFFIPNYFISYFANPIIEVPLLLSNIFLIKSYIPWDLAYFSYNAPSWFLSTLLLLYFITPCLLKYIHMYIDKYNQKILKVVLLAVTIYIIGVIILTLNKVDNQYIKWYIYISPFFRIIDFSIGILAGIFIVYTKKLIKDNKNINIFVFSILEILSILIFLIAYKNRFSVDKFFRFGIYWIPFLLIIVIVFAFERGIISKIISNKGMIFLASISFEFFLIHNVVLHFITRSVLINTPILACILGFIISILISTTIKKMDINNKFYMLIKRKILSN